MSRVAEFLAALEAHGCRGNGRDWQCPAHEDQHASLSVSEGEDGRVLLCCHAGCEPEAIVAAVGWTMADLFPTNGNGRGEFEMETTYPYTDEVGNLLFEVVRFHPKAFRPRRPDGNGGWLWDLKGVRRVPHHLPALIEGVGKDATIYIVEGEKDVHAVENVGGVATCNPGGAGKWKAEYSEFLRGARVRIVADNDRPGLKHAHQVEASLRGIAASTEIVRVAAGKDAHDHLAAGFGLGDFVPLDDEASGQVVQGSPEPDTRPKIVVRGELVNVCNEAVAALVADSARQLYTRARMLVKVVAGAGSKVSGLCRPIGAPHIEVVGSDHLRERLDLAARWVSLKDRGGVLEERPVLPPPWVANVILDRGDWPFPPLEGVIEAPTMRADGSIIEVSGYDPASGLLYLPSTAYPPVPESPSMDEVRAAVEALLDPLVDFPFIAECDRAAAVAAVLTVVARSAIPGPVPCFPVRAPAPGPGKSLLVDLISTIATARVAARMTVPRDDDEVRKRILSIGLEGSPVVLLDNIEGALGSSSLAAALTGTEFADRLLGVSKVVRVPIRTVWLATGNGLTFKGDLGRRVVPIDLDPQLEHPEDRVTFRYPDLLAHVRRERPRLLIAALIVLRAFDQAGRPGHGKPKVGSYEEWDDLIRGAIMWVGLDDPVAGRARVREEGDADLDLIRATYGAWHGAFDSAGRTVAEAIEAAGKDDDPGRELRSALAALDPRSDGTRLNSRVVADRLKRWKGRVVGNLMLKTAGKRHQAMLWQVVRVDSLTVEENPGSDVSEGSQLPVDLDFDVAGGRESWCSGESIPGHRDFESEPAEEHEWESGESVEAGFESEPPMRDMPE